MPAAKKQPAPDIEDRKAPAPRPVKAVAGGGLTAIISKAELSQLRELALEDPRSLKQFQTDAEEMVTLDKEVAAECVFALPREGKIIKGPSARFAEIIGSCYKNCRVSAGIVEETDEFVIGRGYFIDLQKLYWVSIDAPRRIVDRYGRRYSTDMIGTTSSAAISIAFRNTILKAIPKALWSPAYKAAIRIIAGDSKTLAARRQDALDWLAKQGATNDMVFKLLRVRGVEDIGLDEVTTLRGIANAIKDGEVTVEQAFKEADDKPTGVVGAKEALSG